MSALRNLDTSGVLDPARACIAAALERIGAEVGDFSWPDLRLMAGEQRVAAGPGDGLGRVTLATDDLDEMKAWIGFSDHDIRSGRARPTPQAPMRRIQDAQPLDVRRARAAYLFGDSALWRDWRPLIEAGYGSFEIDVVTVGTLSLHRRSRLILAGRPVLFMARRVVFEGGQFVSIVDGYYAQGEILKREAA